MSDFKKRRIVVTGLGIISSIGIGKDAFWKNAIAGKSGISEITTFDTSGYLVHKGGQIKDFSTEEFIDKRKLKYVGRASQLAVAAAKLALEDAKLSRSYLSRHNAGVNMGTTMGETQWIEEIDTVWATSGSEKVRIEPIYEYPPYALTSNVAMEFKLTGPNFIFTTACAAGNYAIGYAYDLLQAGKADLMLAGGSDALSRIAFTGFSRLAAVAPEKCQPFDKNRKGMMVGEGAAVLVLETLENALKRKASIYAEILGYGLSCDDYSMMITIEEGMRFAMGEAIKESGIDKNEVDYISAHGTGTPQNDKEECAAVRNVFGERAKEIPLTSLKSMLGHTMGAASAIEALACCLTVKDDIIPPTINYETPDPECNLDHVPNTGRKQKINIALNNAYAFGSNNSCLVIKKYDERSQ
ncbi:MAG: beta-ketoacyl-[acyl-carrier-protein] synthase family protein [Candidatus Omnitrophica bacterium]|nr:beta-ketoacyl-[acyl-carrier-protein] synthase family protein [Candidatus Omnitrophota bacterium]